jgi:hypothetical protein
MRSVVISGIRPSFPGLSQSRGQVTHVLLTRSPLIHPPKQASALDLHVLSTPPAFVLSQDQTLQQKLAQQSPSPVTGSHNQSTNIKLAQHHQSKQKARHTVEFSKDTRTPTSCRQAGSRGCCSRCGPNLTPRRSSGSVGVPVGPPAPGDRSPVGARSVRRRAGSTDVTRACRGAQTGPGGRATDDPSHHRHEPDLRKILSPSHTNGSYLRSTTRSFSGMSALSVILMCSGHTSVQHLVMLQ